MHTARCSGRQGGGVCTPRFAGDNNLSWMISETNSGGPRTNIEMHSLNPRISFDITATDAASDVVPASLHDRSHVVISLMQDYRQGTRTSNSMLLAIGFCVYRVSRPSLHP